MGTEAMGECDVMWYDYDMIQVTEKFETFWLLLGWAVWVEEPSLS